MKQRWFCSRYGIFSSLTGSLFSLVWMLPAIAQPQVFSTAAAASMIAQQNEVLTRAEIYRLQNQVELLPFNQSPRRAELSDILVPQDAVRTATASIAELLFNEGSIARVDANTTFRFREGTRRFELPNRVAQRGWTLALKPLYQLVQATGSEILQREMIFVLENGTALLMSPPNSVGTQVETPQSTVRIIAPKPVAGFEASVAPQTATPQTATETTSSGLLLPPDRSSAVMVVHSQQQNSTRVFALTDGDIRVFDQSGRNSVPLIGGQTVAVANGQLGPVEEFDLEAFYRTVLLAEGLGPGQEVFVTQQPSSVQITLNAVRIETLAALRRQARDRSTFTGTFLRDALQGVDQPFRGFDGLRGRRTELIIGGERDDGTFERSPNDEDGSNLVRGSFTPDPTPTNSEPTPIDIEADLDSRTVRINGVSGQSSDVGLSGNNAAGTVRLDNGRVIRLEVFDVNGENPRPGQQYRGRFIRGGIQPDY